MPAIGISEKINDKNQAHPNRSLYSNPLTTERGKRRRSQTLSSLQNIMHFSEDTVQRKQFEITFKGKQGRTIILHK